MAHLPLPPPAMSTTKTFASAADLQVKQVRFDKLSEHAYAYTAEGDPNTGVIIGDDAVMVIDTQATPVMAQDVIRRIREVTDKPIRYLLLSHYHAVRVLGASAYRAEGAEHIIASEDKRALIVERGQFDKDSEIGRFPRLFQDLQSVPEGLTWPTLTFQQKMTLWLGQLEVQILQPGRGHTKGDTVAWLPEEKILFSGDLVEFDATPYAGGAYFKDWAQTLGRIGGVQAGLAGTRAFISELYHSVQQGVARGEDLRRVYQGTYARLQPRYGQWVIFNHCMPFDVARAYDEATQSPDPRIWTAERDLQMWQALEG